jgi:hypothetical protein
VLHAPGGAPLRVHADPLELSPDGRWLSFASLHGPWSRIETRFLDDASLSPEALASHVEPWADLPPTGGTAGCGCPCPGWTACRCSTGA